MSAALHQFSGSFPSYHASSDSASSAPIPQSQHPGLDTLAQGSQYALEQLQLSRQEQLNPAPAQQDKVQKDDVFKLPGRRDSTAEARSTIRKQSASGAPVRRRISRACDQCNQLRTKCDGLAPCAHCIGR